MKWCSEPRYFAKDGSGINAEQFADLRNTIVNYTGDIDNIKPIQTAPVGGIATNLYQLKIDELKETSSNRDFSQGGHGKRRNGGKCDCSLTGGRKQDEPRHD